MLLVKFIGQGSDSSAFLFNQCHHRIEGHCLVVDRHHMHLFYLSLRVCFYHFSFLVNVDLALVDIGLGIVGEDVLFTLANSHKTKCLILLRKGFLIFFLYFLKEGSELLALIAAPESVEAELMGKYR